MKSITTLLVTLAPFSGGFLLPGGFSSREAPVVRHSATSLASSISPSAEAESPRTLIRKGMQSFREGDVSSSLAYFDRADNAVDDGSLTPFLWQRGISYYYLDRFREGSEQARFWFMLE